MTVGRLRVAISGSGIVGPGLMTFYNRNLTPAGWPGAVKQFLTSCAPLIAPNVVFDVPNAGDTIDETTGDLVGGWTGTGGGTVTSSGTGVYALGTGARVEWKTSVPFDGYHPRGRTFLVPIMAGAYDSAGRIATANTTVFQNAANALITAGAGDFVVWTRPRKLTTTKRGTLPARAGTIVPITSASVPTTPTSLRSRRV